MQIKAHQSKIYGIDWSHEREHEIITCSLDGTIKVWNIQSSSPDGKDHNATFTIDTAYPVWRARALPFGRGILSLPQRGSTTLKMWAHDQGESPVHAFEGHTDVVKEFVWRKGGRGPCFTICGLITDSQLLDMNHFQLITWSKDRTLRFWPMDSAVLQVFDFYNPRIS